MNDPDLSVVCRRGLNSQHNLWSRLAVVSERDATDLNANQLAIALHEQGLFA